jgi:hypothetical protein
MALGRSPTDGETDRAVQFVDRYAASLAGQETEASQQAAERQSVAWRALCRVILSSSEFLYVE